MNTVRKGCDQQGGGRCLRDIGRSRRRLSPQTLGRFDGRRLGERAGVAFPVRARLIFAAAASVERVRTVPRAGRWEAREWTVAPFDVGRVDARAAAPPPLGLERGEADFIVLLPRASEGVEGDFTLVVRRVGERVELDFAAVPPRAIVRVDVDFAAVPPRAIVRVDVDFDAVPPRASVRVDVDFDAVRPGASERVDVDFFAAVPPRAIVRAEVDFFAAVLPRAIVRAEVDFFAAVVPRAIVRAEVDFEAVPLRTVERDAVDFFAAVPRPAADMDPAATRLEPAFAAPVPLFPLPFAAEVPRPGPPGDSRDVDRAVPPADAPAIPGDERREGAFVPVVAPAFRPTEEVVDRTFAFADDAAFRAVPAILSTAADAAALIPEPLPRRPVPADAFAVRELFREPVATFAAVPPAATFGGGTSCPSRPSCLASPPATTASDVVPPTCGSAAFPSG